jgi:hypothetical protein
MKPPEESPSSGSPDARSSRGDEADSALDRRLTAAATSGAPDEPPGLPGFRTWRGVYLFVLGCYVSYVVLLAVFSRYFA